MGVGSLHLKSILDEVPTNTNVEESIPKQKWEKDKKTNHAFVERIIIGPHHHSLPPLLLPKEDQVRIELLRQKTPGSKFTPRISLFTTSI